MRFSIEQRILQQVIDYLVKKPYSEVAGLVAEIQKDVKAIPETGKDKPEEAKGE
jgi:hypothetical protein